MLTFKPKRFITIRNSTFLTKWSYHWRKNAMNLKKVSEILRRPLHRYFAFERLKKFHAKSRTIDETVSWAMGFGSKGYYKVETSQILFEILSLAKTVEALKPKTILEIGTARGGTLFIWSQLASDEAISCDINDTSIQNELWRAFPPPGSNCRVTLLTGNSHDANFKQQVEKHLGGKKVDFLFIDGDHTKEGVTADYTEYREFVRAGGIIAFHDIVERQALPSNQVYHLWKRLKLEITTEEFINDPNQCGFGIGVIRVLQNT